MDIKLLDWNREDEDYWAASCRATNLSYEVRKTSSGKVRVRTPGEGWYDYDGTVEEACDACQGDYEHRLRKVCTDDEEEADRWMDLALQFDAHRIQALTYLRAVVKGDVTTEQISEFLRKPPLSGEEVLEERMQERMTVAEAARILRQDEKAVDKLVDELVGGFEVLIPDDVKSALDRVMDMEGA